MLNYIENTKLQSNNPPTCLKQLQQLSRKTMRKIRVATAAILHESCLTRDVSQVCNLKVLIGQRGMNGSNAGLWEFPGGKIEKNESAYDAIDRELKEELGNNFKFEIKSQKPIYEWQFIDSKMPITIDLYAFLVWHLNGEITLTNAHKTCQWMTLQQINQKIFKHQILSPGDIPFFQFLKNNHSWINQS